MRKILVVLALALCALGLAQNKVDERLRQRLAQGGTVEVMVEMEAGDLPPGRARQGLLNGLKQQLEGQKLKLKVKPLKGFWLNQSFLVRLPANAVAALASTPGVRRVYENRRVQLPRAQIQGSSAPGGSRWALERIGATELWAAGFRGQGVKIGHLDTGIDPSHPALAGKIAAFAVVDSEGNPSPASPRDTDTHGTHTAGLLVGSEVGVAPEARVVSALVLPGGGGTLAQIIGGMEWAIEQGAQVLSLSLAVQGTWPEFASIVEKVRALGIVGVYAIGNFGPSAESTASPGNLPDALGVGATDQNDQVAAFSSRGPVLWDYPYYRVLSKPDLVAPGVGIVSAVPGGGYMAMSGTSMATPLVAGGAALLLSARPGTPGGTLEQALLDSARPVGSANSAGRGLISLTAALQRLGVEVGAGPNNPPPPPPPTNAAPSLSLSQPASGSTVSSNTVRLEGQASDDRGIRRVSFKLNDEPEEDIRIDPGPSVRFAHTVGFLEPGTNTLTVFAYDLEGQRVSRSLTLNYSSASAPQRVLVVDDDGGLSPDAATPIEATLQALKVPFDTHAVHTAGAVSLEKLRRYPLVLWVLGEAWNDTLSQSDRQNLRSYLQGGGRVLISGQDLGYDIGESDFYREVLRAELEADSSGTLSLLAGESLGGGRYTLMSGDGLRNQYYPSAVRVLSGAEAALLWQEGGEFAQVQAQPADPRPSRQKGKREKGLKERLEPRLLAQSGGVAAGTMSRFGSGRVVYLAFGLEALPSDQRSRLLSALMGWLTR
jgi:hypothetical protein